MVTSSFGRTLGPSVEWSGQPDSTDPGRGGYRPPALEPRQVQFDAQAAQDRANAAAETARAEGLAKEADAYRIAAGIAGSSASLEEQATAITRFQQERQVKMTIGGQRADVAAAGFKESGFALDLLRESVSQGVITDALTMVQGNINKNGYLAQQAAAIGEENAATASSAAAQALAKQYADAGVLATSLSANLAAEIAASDSISDRSSRTLREEIMGGGGGGVTGINVRGGGGSDPFLDGTLVNPAYDPKAEGGHTGTGTVKGGGGFEPNTAGVGGSQTNFGGGGQGTGGETIGPAATPSFIDRRLISGSGDGVGADYGGNEDTG